MRITSLLTSDTLTGYLTSAESRYYQLSEEAASGYKVTKPSDDPSAAKKLININTQLNQLNSYLSNMSSASNELDTLDSTLSSLTDMIENVTDLATQAANGTYSGGDLSKIKTQVDSIIQSVLTTANTQYDGVYIFSGTATSTQTYTTVTDSSTNITSITYNGTPSTGDYERYVAISDGVSVGINATGDSVFGSYSVTTTGGVTTTTANGLFGTLMTLSNALGKNDQAAVSSCLDGLSTALNNVSGVRTKYASVSNRFTLTKNSIDTTITNLKASQSDLRNADLATVLEDLATQEVALQACYQVTSNMIGKTSLLDYM